MIFPIVPRGHKWPPAPKSSAPPEPKAALSDVLKEITEMKAMLVDLKAQIEVFTERRKAETWR